MRTGRARAACTRPAFPLRRCANVPRGRAALAERLGVVEQVDRETDLAAEQLRRGDVDRARRLQRADGVDAAGGEVAERERERAHDPQPVREAGDRRRVARRRATVQRRLEGEDLDRVLRPHARRAARRSAYAPSPRRAVHSSPRAEVVDVAEDDVVHRLAVGDGDREREERDAALRVQRAVDRVDDDERARRRRDGRPPPRRSSRRARGSARGSRPPPPGRSPSSRRRPRPAPTTGSRSARVGSSLEHRLDVRDRRAAEPRASQSSGMQAAGRT